MAEGFTLGIFLASLTACILTGEEVLYALMFGLICFSGYTLYTGVTLRNLLQMLGEGMHRVTNILKIFVLIGCLTALWRISGTIPFILFHSVGWIHPRFLVLCTFLLCSMMSFLTGTSFGTVSTMGVICMMIGNASGAEPYLMAGAILSGIFVGDRCSPMSSSAALVCSLTHTDIYTNIRNMMRTGTVPFLITSVLYVMLALNGSEAVADTSSVAIFEQYFSLHWSTVIPAVLIFILAFLRVDVKIAMAVSVVAALLVSIAVQKIPVNELIVILWQGCRFESGSRMAELLNGGGIRTNIRIMAIVVISASYSGVFAHTELISGIRRAIRHLAKAAKPFGAACFTSVLASMVSCNQSLATILTSQICEELYNEKEELAVTLENTAILVAALVPWNIAGNIPVLTLGSDSKCLLFAFYLYLVPLWNLLKSYFPVNFSRNSVRIS